MKLHIAPSADEAVKLLADYFIATANKAIASNGIFSVALSGGSSPKKLYNLLATPAYSSQVQWNKVYFFFGDERYVPVTDADSNFKMVNEVLFEPLNINAAQIFQVNTILPPDAAATAYMETISLFFNAANPVFDLVLLGLGDNSHTASLFPHTAILHEKEATVKAVFLTDQQVYRISFSAPLINLAGKIVFLVYGPSKAQAVYNIMLGKNDIEEFPAQLIKPSNGTVIWMLDNNAASMLPNDFIATH